MPKMRLITEVFEQLKKEDPETALTLCGLRRLVKTGEIPSVRIGRKQLIDSENLYKFFENSVKAQSVSDEKTTIRRVD